MFAGFPILITFSMPFANLTAGQQTLCTIVSSPIPNLKMKDPASPPNPNSPYFSYTKSYIVDEGFPPGTPVCTISGSGFFPQSAIPNPATLKIHVQVSTKTQEYVEDLCSSEAIFVNIITFNNNPEKNLLVTQGTSPTSVLAGVYPPTFSSEMPSSSAAFVNQLPIDNCYFPNNISMFAFGLFMLGYYFSHTAASQTCTIITSDPPSSYGPKTQNVQIMIGMPDNTFVMSSVALPVCSGPTYSTAVQ
jgi:hypothetical protein